MSKSPDAFRTISEVADWLGVQAHVLRFWESKFSQVKPVKRAGGRRYYRPADMQLLGGIKKLLHDDGLTIKGVQKVIREQGIAEVSALSDPIGGDDVIPEPAFDAKVVPFRSHDTSQIEDAELLEDVPEFVPADAAPTVEDKISEPEHSFAEPVSQDANDESPEIAADTAPAPQGEAPEDALTEPDTVAAETSQAPGDEPTDDVEEPEVQEDAVLPSFLHRRMEPEEKALEPAPLRPNVVEAPDPPREEEIAATPGILSHLAELQELSREEAHQIAPMIAELRALAERLGRSRAN